MQMDDGHLEQLEQLDEEQILAGEGIMGKLAQRNPELVFCVGEHVKVKGGDFEIQSMGRKVMVLRGLPGTRIARR